MLTRVKMWLIINPQSWESTNFSYAVYFLDTHDKQKLFFKTYKKHKRKIVPFQDKISPKNSFFLKLTAYKERVTLQTSLHDLCKAF